MPRRARLCLASVPLHVIQRGNNRSACFFAPGDYRRYLRHLADLAPECGCSVHAYVLMTNHLHLLVTPETADGASLLMKHVGQLYVQYVNRKYGRSGTLWEGRFKSSLAQSENYVLACYRYIESNPVRAAMVRHPGDYPWSSYRANAEGGRQSLVVPHEEFLRLGACSASRQAAYRAMFGEQLESALVEKIRDAASGNVALGDPRFQLEIEAVLGRRARRGSVGRPPIRR